MSGRSRTRWRRRCSAFALLWSLAVHDKRADDQQFIDGVGLRRRVRRRTQRLSASEDATARWIGSDALKELTDR